MGYDLDGELGDGTASRTVTMPKQIASGLIGYNQLSIQLLSGGKLGLSFVGLVGTNYALDRSLNLSPAHWVPQGTNPAGVGGVLTFTNTPDATTNNFWRVRTVP